MLSFEDIVLEFKKQVIFNKKDPCFFFGYKIDYFLALVHRDNDGKCQNLKLLKTEKRQHSI